MSTSAERQRKRRARLRRQGYVDVTVAVPRNQAVHVRRFASNLGDGLNAPVDAGRLLNVIHALKSIQPTLKKAGIEHAGVFGSAARGDHKPDSDIDILIEIDAERVGDILNYVELTETIKDEIRVRYPGMNIDVADRTMLKPNIRKQAELDAVYAF